MALCFHISINALRGNHSGWGDTNYAAALAAALTARGHSTQMFFRGETPDLSGANDVVIRITGPHLEDPVEGVPNILWVISPPNLATAAKLHRYQTRFVCSDYMTQQMQQAGIPAEFLPQATDPGHFHPDRAEADAPRYGFTFVGGYAARAPRRIIVETLRAGYEVNVWGPGWDGVIPAQNWHGERLDYDGLAQVYARSDIILNSHMPHMAAQGMMSNRSYDALASGAAVVSDYVREFDTTPMPDLTMVQDLSTLTSVLDDLLAKGRPAPETQWARHNTMAERFGFAGVADRMITKAEDLLAAGSVPPPSFALDAGGKPATLQLRDPSAANGTGRDALVAAAQEIQRVLDALQHPEGLCVTPAEPASDAAPIHALMADHRAANALALQPDQPGLEAKAKHLAQRARRVVDLVAPERSPLSLVRPHLLNERDIAREMREEPLYAHSPEDYDRDALKPHLRLWDRGQPVPMDRPVGVFVHLYYAELADEFVKWLAHIDAPKTVYVSTDTQAKADQLAQVMPDAEIRVTDNRGRDIFPKFYGFGDVYDRHDVVLHLHGKKSQHSNRLDQWLDHILHCLLPSPAQVNRILSLFQTIPQLGIITPVTHQPVLSAAHWGANYELAQELAWRMGMDPDLPGNDDLRFPVGSMFWGRVDAMRPLLDLRLKAGHFPAENGQLDGTVAHAIERMIGVTAMANGYTVMPVAGADSTIYRGHQQVFNTNKDLREAIKSGLFAP